MALTLEQAEALASDIRRWLAKWNMERECSVDINKTRFGGSASGPGCGHTEPETDTGYRFILEECGLDPDDEPSLVMNVGGVLDEVLVWGGHITAAALTEEALQYCCAMLPNLRCNIESLMKDHFSRHPDEKLYPDEFSNHEEYLLCKFEQEAELTDVLTEAAVRDYKSEITGLAVDELHAIFDKYTKNWLDTHQGTIMVW